MSWRWFTPHRWPRMSRQRAPGSARCPGPARQPRLPGQPPPPPCRWYCSPRAGSSGCAGRLRCWTGRLGKRLLCYRGQPRSAGTPPAPARVRGPPRPRLPGSRPPAPHLPPARPSRRSGRFLALALGMAAAPLGFLQACSVRSGWSHLGPARLAPAPRPTCRAAQQLASGPARGRRAGQRPLAGWRTARALHPPGIGGSVPAFRGWERPWGLGDRGLQGRRMSAGPHKLSKVYK